MKNKILLLSLISALVLGLAACKKDAGDKDYLVNTTWVATDGDETFTLEFKTASTGYGSYTDAGSPEDNESFNFTYSYNPPTVTITPEGERSGSGTVSGNTMKIGDWTLYKQ